MKRFMLFLLLPLVALGQENLTLEQCRKLALTHNQNVKAIQETRKAATQNRRAAFTQFLPRLDFVGNYTHVNKKIQYETPDVMVPIQDMSTGQPMPSPYLFYLPSQKLEFGQENIYLLSLGITQPIFTGGKILQQYKISKYLEKMAGANQDLTIAEIIVKTDERYWQVVSVNEKVALATQYQEMIAKHLEDLQNFLDEGLITRNDLLKAQVKFNEAELSLLKAENGLALSKMALNQLIGFPLSHSIEPAEELDSDFTDQNLTSSPELALQRRAEIKLLENTVKINNSVVNLNRSRYLPNILFQANYLNANPNPYNSFKDEFGSDWFVGVTCAWDLFHWNERGFQVSAAKHQRKAAQLKLEETKEMINLEIQQAIFQVSEAGKKVQMTTKSLQQAEENLKVTKDNFSEGIAKNSDVLDAQTLWQKAYSENIDAKVEFKINQTKLEKALGELTAEEGVK